jgi:hypothetical protein
VASRWFSLQSGIRFKLGNLDWLVDRSRQLGVTLGFGNDRVLSLAPAQWLLERLGQANAAGLGPDHRQTIFLTGFQQATP